MEDDRVQHMITEDRETGHLPDEDDRSEDEREALEVLESPNYGEQREYLA